MRRRTCTKRGTAWYSRHVGALCESMDILEGTEQIQRLVIGCTISGQRIE